MSRKQAPQPSADTPETPLITIEEGSITIEDSVRKGPREPSKPVAKVELPNGLVIEDY